MTNTGKAQELLSSLLTAEMALKETHWNMSGVGFISVHRYLDEIYDSCEEFYDELAEHMVAFGFNPPEFQFKRPVGKKPSHFRSGSVEDAIEHVVDHLSDILKSADECQEDADAELEDICVRVSQKYREHVWFLNKEKQNV